MTVRSLSVLKTVVIAVFLQAGVQPATQQDRAVEKGSIEGVVLRAASGEPLDRARVKLYPVLSRDQERELYRDGNDPEAGFPSVMTEADGKFALKNIAPGPYRITASRNAYVPQAYGQRVPEGSSTIINLAPGQVVKDIVIRMIQGGVVTGRVRDSAGEPIAGLQVSLMRMEYNETGGKSLWGDDQVQTDDRGEYRFYWIPAGRYYVHVGGRQRYDGKNIIEDQPIVAVFYPGVPDPERATVVEVQAGSERSAIDIVMPRVSGYRIRGRLVDASTGKPPKNADMSLISRKPTAFMMYNNGGESSRAQYNPTTGTFEIRDVEPGIYWLSATAQAGYNEPLSPDKLADVKTRDDLFQTAFSSIAGAQIPLDITASDLNDVVITLTKGISIPVQLSIEGQELSAVKGADEIRVGLSSTSQENGYRRGSRLNADGTGKVDNVQPGEFRVSVDTAATKDLYTKEIRYGRADALFDPLLISDQPQGSLTVVLSGKGGRIEGNLIDALSQPAADVEVILIPDSRDRKRLYRDAATDQNGHFEFRAVPPGGYKVFAWEALESNAYYDPDVLSRYETQGRPVRVQESSKETIELKIIPAPKQ